MFYHLKLFFLFNGSWFRFSKICPNFEKYCSKVPFFCWKSHNFSEPWYNYVFENSKPCKFVVSKFLMHSIIGRNIYLVILLLVISPKSRGDLWDSSCFILLFFSPSKCKFYSTLKYLIPFFQYTHVSFSNHFQRVTIASQLYIPF